MMLKQGMPGVWMLFHETLPREFLMPRTEGFSFFRKEMASLMISSLMPLE